MVSVAASPAIAPNEERSYWALDWCDGFDWQLRCRTTAALPRLLFTAIALAYMKIPHLYITIVLQKQYFA
ncbi:hypothetical protein [uncultured Nostoc sp.]|uniref:hypothetical protein n=1 Tax=uncultured Nostoc sp. TaxID=340711 RepID=UPI0035C9B464